MNSNIFGEDTSGAPDISDEGLQWEADDTFDGLEGEASLPSDDEGQNANTNDGDVSDIEVVEGDEDGANEQEVGEIAEELAAADDADIPEAFRGKTAAELVRIIQDSQSHIGRQANELGQLRQMVEEVRQMQQQAQPQPQMAPASEYIHDTDDGVRAYREGVSLLDEGRVGPEAIDEIIRTVRQFDPDTAAIMDRDFGMRLARAEMNVQMAPVVQQSYELALRQATAEVNQDPDAQSYRDDIVRMVHQPQTLAEQQIAVAYANARTATDIKSALTAAIQLARGADPTKSHHYSALLQQQKQNEQSEGPNAVNANQQAPMTEEERIIDQLLNKKSGADALFAGFGA